MLLVAVADLASLERQVVHMLSPILLPEVLQQEELVVLDFMLMLVLVFVFVHLLVLMVQRILEVAAAALVEIELIVHLLLVDLVDLEWL
jgi:hypothetical protein